MMALDLSADEQRNVRTALKFLRSRCGTWANVAKVLGFKHTTLCAIAGARKTVSARLAFRIAKFAKTSVDDVITGKFPKSGTCPSCGHVEE